MCNSIDQFSWRGLPTVIFGTSGISQEALCVLNDINGSNYTDQFEFLGFVAEHEADIGKPVGKHTVITSDYSFRTFAVKYPVLGVVIPIGSPNIKQKIYEDVLKDLKNVVFPNLISPKAHLGSMDSIKFGVGNIICAGCTLTTNISISNFNLININSTIGHGVTIKDYCVVNPMVSISGDVAISHNSLIGAGSTILQGLHIGKNSVIGAGSVVVKDIPDGVVAYGNPCQVVRKNQ